MYVVSNIAYRLVVSINIPPVNAAVPIAVATYNAAGICIVIYALGKVCECDISIPYNACNAAFITYVSRLSIVAGQAKGAAT